MNYPKMAPKSGWFYPTSDGLEQTRPNPMKNNLSFLSGGSGFKSPPQKKIHIKFVMRKLFLTNSVASSRPVFFNWKLFCSSRHTQVMSFESPFRVLCRARYVCSSMTCLSYFYTLKLAQKYICWNVWQLLAVENWSNVFYYLIKIDEYFYKTSLFCDMVKFNFEGFKTTPASWLKYWSSNRSLNL